MSDSDYTIPISQSEESNQESQAEYGYKILNSGDILHQRYSIVKELGSGGFATTYLAIDLLSKPQVKCAVKQLQPRFNSPAIWASAKERLATEAMVLQWLGNHDRIPQLLAHFEENQQFYLVLEFIEGEEFEQEVQRHPLDEAQIIDFLLDILEVLDFVHQQGVIHRDIKPSNLIRRKKDGKMTLIDFGAVKEIGTLAFDSQKQRVQTQIIGTPGYMPPEQNNGKPLYSSDIYALGKTVIFALTGKSPTEWEDNDSHEIVNWYDTIQVSEALINIINRMTAPKTTERYQTVKKVIQDLKPLLMVNKVVGGNYQIIKYLGSRPKIHSYLVKDLATESNIKYYLKIISIPNLSKKSLDLFVKKITNKLNDLERIEDQKCISQIINYFIDQDHFYLIQEYLEGVSLSKIIQRNFVLSETEVIELLIDIAEALNSIHKHHIVHGNIQPSSLIKLSGDHKIALVNFGFIQEAVGLLPDNKAGYVPPEQIAAKAIVASDIYALGMTAIHILTGTVPQNLEKNPRTGEILWHHQARISSAFAKVLDKTICLDKRQRYQSAARVIKDLKAIQHKSKFKSWYKYLLILLISPLMVGIVLFGLAHWAQRVAILEFYKADLKLEAKQYQQAVEYYDNGLKKLPKTRGQVRHFEQVWLKKSKALSQLKRYDEALETCNNALKYYQSYQLWNCKALALDSLRKYEEAVTAYDRAIALEPEYLWAWNNRGEAYTELGEVNKALFDFQRAIELDPAQSYIPWNNIGKLRYRQQDYQKASEAYEQALTVKEDYLPAVIGLGNVYKNIKNYSTALKYYDRALAIAPDYYEAWYGKGSVNEYLGEYEEAKRNYQQAYSLKPDWEAVIKAIQRIDRKLGN